MVFPCPFSAKTQTVEQLTRKLRELQVDYDARVWQSAGPRSYLAENVTEASGDRCWNCGMVPKRWFDVTPPGLDEQRLVCANCFARTTRPLPHYGWARSRSADWDEGDDDEEQPDSDWS